MKTLSRLRLECAALQQLMLSWCSKLRDEAFVSAVRGLQQLEVPRFHVIELFPAVCVVIVIVFDGVALLFLLTQHTYRMRECLCYRNPSQLSPHLVVHRCFV